VLAVLGCLLSIVAVVAVWGRNQVLDTDRYLATVEPLASDEVIQDEITAKVTAAIQERLDSEALVRRYLRPRSAPLISSFAGALDQLVETQTKAFVHSEAFQRLWVAVNRGAHDELVRVLTGHDSPTVSVDDGRLTLDLTVVVQAVRDRLLQAGLEFVARMPPIALVVDIADARGLESARTAVRWLDRAADWLPVVALALLGSAVLLAQRRRRATLLVLGGLVGAMVLTLLLVRIGSSVAADHVPASAATPDAVHAYYDGVTRLLRRGATVVGLLALAGALALLAIGRARSLRAAAAQP
jgi:hypothetical protein